MLPVRLPTYVNVSRGCKATQSSVSQWSAPSGASAALSGMASGSFSFHTGEQIDPWWEVDLREIVPIRKIVIYNRDDLASKKLTLSISYAIHPNYLREIYRGETCFGGLEHGSPFIKELENAIYCRYIRITALGKTYLHLDQILVLGDAHEIFETKAVAKHFGVSKYFDYKGQMYNRYDLYYDTTQVNHTSKPEISCLLVRPFGRFGNFIMQITHAVAMARYVGVKRIYYDPAMQDTQVFQMDKTVEVADIELKRFGFSQIGADIALEGTYFDLRALEVSRPTDQKALPSLPADVLLPFLSPEIMCRHPQISDDDVVVHVRAGDVFAASHINTAYVQPPLAFYTKSITICVAQGHRSFWLVFEDDSNPVVDALRKFCREQGLRVVEQSSSFKNDLTVLMSATTIIASYGTLIPAVMRFSRHLQIVYEFDNVMVENIGHLVGERLRVVGLTDRAGKYPKPGQWTASKEQLSQLIGYSLDDLALKADA